jgi:hypothetical protein
MKPYYRTVGEVVPGEYLAPVRRREPPAIADQLVSIPASGAEAERTIKIIRAMLGKHSCQMSIAMLIARVRLAMQYLQNRRASRRDAHLARAAGLPPQDVGAPRVAIDEVDGNGFMRDTERSPTPRADMSLRAHQSEVVQERWPTS